MSEEKPPSSVGEDTKEKVDGGGKKPKEKKPYKKSAITAWVIVAVIFVVLAIIAIVLMSVFAALYAAVTSGLEVVENALFYAIYNSNGCTSSEMIRCSIVQGDEFPLPPDIYPASFQVDLALFCASVLSALEYTKETSLPTDLTIWGYILTSQPGASPFGIVGYSDRTAYVMFRGTETMFERTEYLNFGQTPLVTPNTVSGEKGPSSLTNTTQIAFSNPFVQKRSASTLAYDIIFVGEDPSSVRRKQKGVSMSPLHYLKKKSTASFGNPCQGNALVHEGFLSIFDQVKDQVYQILIDHHTEYDNIIMSGHSLGGAIISIMSLYVAVSDVTQNKTIAVYTFGKPRVGNPDYANCVTAKVPFFYRIENMDDMVTQLPIVVTPNFGEPLNPWIYQHEGIPQTYAANWLSWALNHYLRSYVQNLLLF